MGADETDMASIVGAFEEDVVAFVALFSRKAGGVEERVVFCVDD